MIDIRFLRENPDAVRENIRKKHQDEKLPLVDGEGHLTGLITVKDIATANMDLFDTGILAKSRTSYKNILETLGATMAVGSEDAVCTTGHIRIGTATNDLNTVVCFSGQFLNLLCCIGIAFCETVVDHTGNFRNALWHLLSTLFTGFLHLARHMLRRKKSRIVGINERRNRLL